MKIASTLVACMSSGFVFLTAGIVVHAVRVYHFDQFDPKFGRDGSFWLSCYIQEVFSVGWAVLFFIALAMATMFESIEKFIENTTWPQLIVYSGLLGLLPLPFLLASYL